MIQIIFISCIPSTAVAALMMAAAWSHNSQGEIHRDGIIDWNYWLLLGFSWFALLFIPIFLILLVIHILCKQRADHD